MATKTKYICKCCGKEYYSYKENSNYCSHECRNKANIYYHNCDYCGKEFKIAKREYEKMMSGEKKHSYCSKECANLGLKTGIMKICEECGKGFYVEKSVAEITKYCSMKCYDKHRANMYKLDVKKCLICGKGFTTYHHDQIYCSLECSGRSQRKREECICDYCGKTIERKVSDTNRKGNNYCSNECRLESLRWNAFDIDILRKNYRRIKTSEIQKMLSKEYSIKAICSRAIDFGFAKSRLWSKDEEKIIIDNYERIPMHELLKLLPNRSLSSIKHKAQQNNLLSNFYKNHVYSQEDIKFLQDNYLLKTNEELAEILKRTPYAIEQKLRVLSLYRPFETKKDGYYDLNKFIRSKLYHWKNEVREFNNYTCFLTGSRSNIVVHHCRSFNLLFEESMEILDFPDYDNFEQYTEEELQLFLKTFLDLQEYYNAYVCITEDIHKLFHREYGYGDNTEEQWDEFVTNYNNGLYDNKLKQAS